MSRFASIVPTFQVGITERFANSPDARVARIAVALQRKVSPQTSKHILTADAEEHLRQRFATVDGRGLCEAAASPPLHEWVDDGTLLTKGGT